MINDWLTLYDKYRTNPNVVGTMAAACGKACVGCFRGCGAVCKGCGRCAQSCLKTCTRCCKRTSQKSAKAVRRGRGRSSSRGRGRSKSQSRQPRQPRQPRNDSEGGEYYYSDDDYDDGCDYYDDCYANAGDILPPLLLKMDRDLHISPPSTTAKCDIPQTPGPIDT